MAQTMMQMQRRLMATSGMVLLLLLVLALQLRESSAVQDANKILIKSVAEEQQSQMINDLTATTSMNIAIGSGRVTGRTSDGRIFYGTGASPGVGAGAGTLLAGDRIYEDTTSYEVRRSPIGNIQIILFKNAQGRSVGTWSGVMLPDLLPPSAGPGRFV